MGRSKVVWRMGKQWPAIIDRSRAFAPDIPDTGISRAEFEHVVLTDVDPIYIDEVLAALHRRKIIHVSRNRGAVIVYGSRPVTRDKPEWASSTSPLATFVATIAPHALAALDAADDYWRDVSCGRIVRLAAKHEERGLPLSDIRAALWRLFPAEVMKRVAWHEPRLMQGSTAVQFDRPEPASRQLPRGLSKADRILAMIEKAGRQGISKTALIGGLPHEQRAGTEPILEDHERAGLIVSGVMRVAATGRPGLRFFSAKYGLPYVDGKGMARFS